MTSITTHTTVMTHAHAAPRRRNRWTERLAHALPYLLFAAVMLLLDSIGRGATQEEFFKSVQQSVNQGPVGEGGVSLRGFAMFLGVAGLLVTGLILANRFQRRAPGAAKPAPRALSKPTNINQPRKLVKEIARAAGLSGDELRQLKAAADELGHASPLTLLICPSLLIEAARKDDTNADKAVLARVARRIIAN